MSDPLEQVSVEQDGIILTGMGETEESLRDALPEAKDPAPESPPSAPESKPEERNAKGQYTRAQKRFDQLTGEREAEKRARETAEKERDEWRQKFEQAQSRPPDRVDPVGQNGHGQPAVAAQASAAAETTRQKPTEAEIGTKYQTYADFAEDLADWKVEQRLTALDFDARIRQSIEADRASRSRVDLVTQVHERGRKAYQNFDAVLQAPHMTAANWPSDKLDAIAEMAEPWHIQYALGRDPALAESLRTMGPIQFGQAIAKLMPASAVAQATPASTASVGTVTAPPPYQPVGSGSSTTVPPLEDAIDRAGYDFDKLRDSHFAPARRRR